MNSAPLDLATVTVEDFTPFVGEQYSVLNDEARPIGELKLVAAEKWGGNRDSERPFSLFFEGLAEMPFPQQTMSLRHDSGVLLELFLVPISEGLGVRSYQAVFN